MHEHPLHRFRETGILIGISLRGDGRLFRIDQRSVRFLFDAFVDRDPKIAYQFCHQWMTDRKASTPLIERLTARGASRFSEHEVRAVESQCSALVIRKRFPFSLNAHRVEKGSVSQPRGPADRRRSNAIFLNGACFEVTRISKSILLQGGPRDIVLIDDDGARLIRFLRVDVFRGQIQALFQNRYDLRIAWASPIDEIPKQCFSVRRAAPLPGFYIQNCARFLSGV